MKRTNDPEVDLLIHGIKATETLMDNMRVIVHDGDVYLGEFDIACCLQHRGPSFRELSDRIRFGWRAAQCLTPAAPAASDEQTEPKQENDK